MSRTCTVCRHEKRTEIESALLERQPFRSIAAQFGPSKASLIRHREHLPTGLAVAKKAEAAANGDSLLAQITTLQAQTMNILASAEEAGDHRTCLMAVHQARENIGLHLPELRPATTDTLGALFEKMTSAELERYACEGTPPDWFENAVGDTRSNDSETPG